MREIWEWVPARPTDLKLLTSPSLVFFRRLVSKSDNVCRVVSTDMWWALQMFIIIISFNCCNNSVGLVGLSFLKMRNLDSARIGNCRHHTAELKFEPTLIWLKLLSVLKTVLGNQSRINTRVERPGGEKRGTHPRLELSALDFPVPFGWEAVVHVGSVCA